MRIQTTLSRDAFYRCAHTSLGDGACVRFGSSRMSSLKMQGKAVQGWISSAYKKESHAATYPESSVEQMSVSSSL